MENTGVIDILKKALLLEKRGQAFYQKVADQCKIPELKEFFSSMSQEEQLHIKVLSDQFRSYNKNETLDMESLEEAAKSGFDLFVLSEDIKNQISAASFEGAAISAAVSMEKGAVELYSLRAENAETEEEKKLYQWLTKWEQGHLEELILLDKELCEKIWYDNQFWPF